MASAAVSVLLLSAQPAAAMLESDFDPYRTSCTYDTSNVVTYNIADDFGSGNVNRSAIISAINAAEDYWDTTDPDANIVLEIDAGTWDIAGSPAIRLIGLNSTRQNDDGWLIFKGQSMALTTLNFTDIEARGFFGRNAYRVHFCNFHITRDQETVSQGEIVGYLQGASWSADPDPDVYGDETLDNPGTFDTSGTTSEFPVVELHSGFPTIADIYNDDFGQGRYTKRWRYNANGEPYRVQDDQQAPWEQYADYGSGRWVLGMYNDPGYEIGDTIAIKSKLAGEPFFFNQGDSITVENIRVTRASRMLFRGGVDNITFRNVSIERQASVGGRIPFLSTAEGGPQMGQPDEGPLTNIVVEDMQAFGTGDDPLAAFDVTGLFVTSSTFSDSFARGILLDDTSTTPCITDTLVERAPIAPENPSYAWGCQSDSTPPSAVTFLTASAATAGVDLSWTDTPPMDFDGYVITRTEAGGSPYEIANGVSGTSYTDISAEAGVQYTYEIEAFDTSRNRSSAASVTITP
nr:hypothetical protein GCM10011355_01120 [Aquisalinus luteolus]